jgi:hypothetical protein
METEFYGIFIAPKETFLLEFPPSPLAFGRFQSAACCFYLLNTTYLQHTGVTFLPSFYFDIFWEINCCFRGEDKGFFCSLFTFLG